MPLVLKIFGIQENLHIGLFLFFKISQKLQMFLKIAAQFYKLYRKYQKRMIMSI